jgi:hypothetical protein
VAGRSGVEDRRVEPPDRTAEAKDSLRTARAGDVPRRARRRARSRPARTGPRRWRNDVNGDAWLWLLRRCSSERRGLPMASRCARVRWTLKNGFSVGRMRHRLTRQPERHTGVTRS